jgi:uncharacterized membrane protein
MTFLRFLMLLSLVLWLGGVMFLAFVVAPSAFSPGLLPTRHLAGAVVGRCLTALHWMGIVSGVVFLITSMIYSRTTIGSAHPFAARHVLIAIMLLLTFMSQFVITPKMYAIRTQAVVIDNLSQDDPMRVEFNRLHQWSEKFEGAVLLLGLGALYLTARALK